MTGIVMTDIVQIGTATEAMTIVPENHVGARTVMAPTMVETTVGEVLLLPPQAPM
jgi:hypothetical protein